MKSIRLFDLNNGYSLIACCTKTLYYIRQLFSQNVPSKKKIVVTPRNHPNLFLRQGKFVARFTTNVTHKELNYG